MRPGLHQLRHQGSPYRFAMNQRTSARSRESACVWGLSSWGHRTACMAYGLRMYAFVPNVATSSKRRVTDEQTFLQRAHYAGFPTCLDSLHDVARCTRENQRARASRFPTTTISVVWSPRNRVRSGKPVHAGLRIGRKDRPGRRSGLGFTTPMLRWQGKRPAGSFATKNSLGPPWCSFGSSPAPRPGVKSCVPDFPPPLLSCLPSHMPRQAGRV
jgi:hypothetical protein